MATSETATFLDQPAESWIELLGNADPLLRRLAAHALGMLGENAREVVNALAAALRDEEPFVRVWAAAALARIDRRSRKAAVDVLKSALDEPQHFVRSLAAWHLGRLGRSIPGVRVATRKLEKLLADPDPSVRREAADALKRLQLRKACASCE